MESIRLSALWKKVKSSLVRKAASGPGKDYNPDYLIAPVSEENGDDSDGKVLGIEQELELLDLQGLDKNSPEYKSEKNRLEQELQEAKYKESSGEAELDVDGPVEPSSENIHPADAPVSMESNKPSDVSIPLAPEKDYDSLQESLAKSLKIDPHQTEYITKLFDRWSPVKLPRPVKPSPGSAYQENSLITKEHDRIKSKHDEVKNEIEAEDKRVVPNPIKLKSLKEKLLSIVKEMQDFNKKYSQEAIEEQRRQYLYTTVEEDRFAEVNRIQNELDSLKHEDDPEKREELKKQLYEAMEAAEANTGKVLREDAKNVADILYKEEDEKKKSSENISKEDMFVNTVGKLLAKTDDKLTRTEEFQLSTALYSIAKYFLDGSSIEMLMERRNSPDTFEQDKANIARVIRALKRLTDRFAPDIRVNPDLKDSISQVVQLADGRLKDFGTSGGGDSGSVKSSFMSSWHNNDPIKISIISRLYVAAGGGVKHTLRDRLIKPGVTLVPSSGKMNMPELSTGVSGFNYSVAFENMVSTGPALEASVDALDEAGEKFKSLRGELKQKLKPEPRDDDNSPEAERARNENKNIREKISSAAWDESIVGDGGILYKGGEKAYSIVSSEFDRMNAELTAPKLEQVEDVGLPDRLKNKNPKKESGSGPIDNKSSFMKNYMSFIIPHWESSLSLFVDSEPYSEFTYYNEETGQEELLPDRDRTVAISGPGGESRVPPRGVVSRDDLYMEDEDMPGRKVLKDVSVLVDQFPDELDSLRDLLEDELSSIEDEELKDFIKMALAELDDIQSGIEENRERVKRTEIPIDLGNWVETFEQAAKNNEFAVMAELLREQNESAGEFKDRCKKNLENLFSVSSNERLMGGGAPPYIETELQLFNEDREIWEGIKKGEGWRLQRAVDIFNDKLATMEGTSGRSMSDWTQEERDDFAYYNKDVRIALEQAIVDLQEIKEIMEEYESTAVSMAASGKTDYTSKKPRKEEDTFYTFEGVKKRKEGIPADTYRSLVDKYEKDLVQYEKDLADYNNGKKDEKPVEPVMPRLEPGKRYDRVPFKGDWGAGMKNRERRLELEKEIARDISGPKKKV